MKIGFNLAEISNADIYKQKSKVVPDFWINTKTGPEYVDFLPQNFRYLPSANHLRIAKQIRQKKLDIKDVKSKYLNLNEEFFEKSLTANIKTTKYVVFNEVFDQDNRLRNFYNLDFFKAGLSQVKRMGGMTVFNEHRLISLFLMRQKEFISLVEPLIKEGLIDYIGLQVWDAGRPLEFEITWLLIKIFQSFGAKVLISEFGIYEPDREKQAFRATNYLRFFEDSGIESVGYWWLRDGPHTAMPIARDSDKNPGLYTADWEPKPILDVFAKYVGTTN